MSKFLGDDNVDRMLLLVVLKVVPVCHSWELLTSWFPLKNVTNKILKKRFKKEKEVQVSATGF